MAVWAVVVGAGAGTRFGGAKQYARLGGQTVLSRSVASARAACDAVVLVVPPGDEALPEVTAAGADVVVAGGPTRSASVRAGLAAVPAAGLAAVPADEDIVVVHDAARPLAGPQLFAAAVAAVRDGADGAICAVPIVDTVKRIEGDRVVNTLDRAGLVAVQTPQAFRASALRAAHASCPEASDDAAVVEGSGGKVVVVAGDPANIKLTGPADLAVARALLT